MKNKTNADVSTQRRGGAKTQNDGAPSRETPAATGRTEEKSTGGNGGNGEKSSVSSAASCSTRQCSRAEGAKQLSEKQITQKRHALFEKFADFAVDHLDGDPALACKAAETALKALSAGEHDHPGASPTPGDDALKTPALSKFNEDLERAYGL